MQIVVEMKKYTFLFLVGIVLLTVNLFTCRTMDGGLKKIPCINAQIYRSVPDSVHNDAVLTINFVTQAYYLQQDYSVSEMEFGDFDLHMDTLKLFPKSIVSLGSDNMVAHLLEDEQSTSRNTPKVFIMRCGDLIEYIDRDSMENYFEKTGNDFVRQIFELKKCRK